MYFMGSSSSGGWSPLRQTGSDEIDTSVYPRKYAQVSRVCSLSGMTYVIAGSCIKDDSCIEVCPVDCIHPKPGDRDFETAEQLYIDPEVCIDCDACVEACPVDAIFPDFDTPEKYDYALDLNAEFFAERSTAERTAA
jgi:ferredoxin